MEFDNLDKMTKSDEYSKWKWLGSKLDFILSNAKNLETTDVDSHVIWPAIGQYFREELKRGFDAKRSGEKKDHYRKCWLLATIKDTDWIDSWGGWDAYVDRGDQLVINNQLMPELKKKFGSIAFKLKSKDHQRIAKMLTETMPSGTSHPSEINAMELKHIQKAVKDVYNKFISAYKVD